MAKNVFVMGCNEQNFPCKTSDHPVIGMIKIEDYDKEEEEKRLFYVALSRAKSKLYLTYSGKNLTKFINDKMLSVLNNEDEKEQPLLEEFSKEDSEDLEEESEEETEEEVEEQESGYFGKFESSVGQGYSDNYNPYESEDWGGIMDD